MKFVLMKQERLAGRQTIFTQPEYRPLVELDDLLNVAEEFLQPLRGGIPGGGLCSQVAGGQ
jgi:hypothetical protein